MLILMAFSSTQNNRQQTSNSHQTSKDATCTSTFDWLRTFIYTITTVQFKMASLKNGENYVKGFLAIIATALNNKNTQKLPFKDAFIMHQVCKKVSKCPFLIKLGKHFVIVPLLTAGCILSVCVTSHGHGWK